MDEQPNGPPLDRSAVLARFGGDADFAAECAEVLEAELPAMIESLRDGVRTGSAERLHRAAHTLKGALSNFCEDGPTRTAGQIDSLARDGRIDEARPLLAVLEQELAAFVLALRGLRSPSSS